MRFSKKIFETCWAVSSSIFTLKAHDFLRSGRGRYWHIHSVGTTFVGNSKSIYVHQIEILFGLLSWNQVVCFAEWIWAWQRQLQCNAVQLGQWPQERWQQWRWWLPEDHSSQTSLLDGSVCSNWRFCRSTGWTGRSSAEWIWTLHPPFHKIDGTLWHSADKEGLVLSYRRTCTNADLQARPCGSWQMCRPPPCHPHPSPCQCPSLCRWCTVCEWRAVCCSDEMKTLFELWPTSRWLLPCLRRAEMLWWARRPGFQRRSCNLWSLLAGCKSQHWGLLEQDCFSQSQAVWYHPEGQQG